MINIQDYISSLIDLLKDRFGSRLLYVGLQGSYLRGEATDTSDIDIMAVIDSLSVSDLSVYRSVLQYMDHFDLSCGFICSKSDLSCWNPLEICHLLHTTQDHYGVLKDLVPPYSQEDVRNFVKMSLNNLYHEICHRYIHSTPQHNANALPGTYKAVFFILQNLYYLQSGRFIITKAELLSCLEGKDRAVLQRSLDLRRGIPYDFDECFHLIFSWCQETLASL